MSEQKPSVGRIVHYVGKGGACTAATVTEVDEQGHLVGLFVTGPSAVHLLPLDEGGAMADHDEQKPGTWHWPERV